MVVSRRPVVHAYVSQIRLQLLQVLGVRLGFLIAFVGGRCLERDRGTDHRGVS